MNERFKNPLFYTGILGAVKMASATMGYPMFTDHQVEDIANGLAAIATVIGVVISYIKKE